MIPDKKPTVEDLFSQWFDGEANSKNNQRTKDAVAFVVTLLTEDPRFTVKYLTKEMAQDLINLVDGRDSVGQQTVEDESSIIELIKTYDACVEKTKEALIDLCDKVQHVQPDRELMVASIMNARDITKPTAEAQWSRFKKVLMNEDTIKQIEDGNFQLSIKTDSTKKYQKN